MLYNLRAEMARHAVRTADIAERIGRSERSVREKIKGSVQFSIGEARTIKETLFPDCSLEYLFATDEETEGGAWRHGYAD